MFKIGDRVEFLSVPHTGWSVPYTACYGVVDSIVHDSATKIHLYETATGRDVYIGGHHTWTFPNSYLKRIVEKKEKPVTYVGYKIDLSWIKGTAREVLSKAVQEKAFELGYKWGTRGYLYTTSPYLYMEDSYKDISYGEKLDTFKEEVQHKEVSVNNWLEGKLPVTKPAYCPKKGDAVLTRDTTKGTWIVGVFHSMSGKQYTTYHCNWNFCIPFDADLEGTTKEPK